MSTDWGYKCVDCDVVSDTWINHGDDVLAELARATKLLDDNGFTQVFVTSDWDRASGEARTFLEEHTGHNVVLHNEYGVTKPIEGGEN